MTNVISAAQVRELRDRTGAPMMDCKRALETCQGDMEKASEELRKQGISKAGKKAGRIAAEGLIAIAEADKRAVMLEVNCETDFVARDTNFTNFVKSLANTALESSSADVEQLSHIPLLGQTSTVEEARQELVAKIGENVQIRRFVRTRDNAGTVGTYLHGNRIGVMVELDTDNKELARDLAMHIAASRPLVITPEDVPAELVAKEKEIFTAQASTSGKPADIVEKMVLGKLKKYLDEVSLMGQPFVKDQDTTVGALLNKHRAKVLAFHRYEVGEGIEKVTEDFKEAVMQQVQGG